MLENDVLTFLKSREGNIFEFQPLEGGEHSKSFLFTSKLGKYVIRLRRSKTAFEKDRIAHEQLKLTSIVIPQTHEIGQFNSDLHYSITEWIPGKGMKAPFRPETIQSTLSYLKLVHTVDISSTSNFGKWRDFSQGSNKSWKKYLVGEIKKGNYWGKLLRSSILQSSLYDEVVSKIINVIDNCPEQRNLVHGDFGYDNLLYHNGRITGVIDWELSMFGDFVYDIAWLDFWSGDAFSPHIFDFYESPAFDLGNISTRLFCYKLIIGLFSIGFFAERNDRRKYLGITKKIKDILNNSHL